MKTAFRTNVLASLCLSVIFACGFISAANAEDILMNSGSVIATTSNVNLIRTAMTPSQVDVALPIAMGETVCAEYGTRTVSGQNGARCGYTTMVRRVCVPEQVCRIDARTGRRVCTTMGRRCYNQVVQVARFCSWEETYCARTETRTVNKTRTLTLKFKNMSTLSNEEQEVFQLVGEQNHTDGQDAIFNLSALTTRKPVSIKARDGVFTGFKDVIVIKGE